MLSRFEGAFEASGSYPAGAESSGDRTSSSAQKKAVATLVFGETLGSVIDTDYMVTNSQQALYSDKVRP